MHTRVIEGGVSKGTLPERSPLASMHLPTSRFSAHASLVDMSIDGRRRRRAVLAALALLLGLVVAESTSEVATASRIWHVSPDGSDQATGQAGDPLATIGRAVQLAHSGDTVSIGAGRYHESVQVYRKALHLRGAPAAGAGGADEADGVVLDGAIPVSGWAASEGAWFASWSTDFERVEAPFTTPERPEAAWPEMFFLDGVALREVAARSEVGPGTFHHDRVADRVWLGDDPTGRLVEGSALNWGLYLNEAHGSSVEHLTVRRYATQNRNMAAVRAYADDLSVANVTVESNARIGLSVMGARVAVSDVTAHRNGHLGIHGHRGTALAFERVVVTQNNAEGFDPKHSAGGMKITDTDGLTVTRAVVTDNAGPGIWTDLDVIGAVVRSSVASRNGRSGIEIELSTDVVVIDNVAEDNGEAGVWVLESSDVEVWHNSLFGNVRDVYVLDGDRADLTDVAVINNLLGGGRPGAPALLNVDDWTEQRSAEQMRVKVDANRYWMSPTSATPLVSRWARWPYSLALSPDVETHRSVTGAGLDDVVIADANPFVRSSSDARVMPGAPLGLPLTDRVTAASALLDTAYPAGAVTRPADLADDGVTVTTPPGSTATPPPGSTVPPPTTTPTTPTTTPGSGGGQGGIDTRAVATRPASAERVQTRAESATPTASPSNGARAAADQPPAATTGAGTATETMTAVSPRRGGWSVVVQSVEAAVASAAERSEPVS
ncbi:MAG: right-handed parallel beta-helix repeat-containing protein [Ilumatobacter sp.]|uniref:right-handed parallel beta-helix repeat-containing protein n=1 Tax=Ilumatobacter sp. TaxID=1967498 RepID=UPI00391A118A